MSDNAVYVEDTWPHLPVAVRVEGKLLPVVSEDSVDVRFADNSVTTVTLTLLAPGMQVTSVASEEAEALRSEAYDGAGGSK